MILQQSQILRADPDMLRDELAERCGEPTANGLEGEVHAEEHLEGIEPEIRPEPTAAVAFVEESATAAVYISFSIHRVESHIKCGLGDVDPGML